MTEVRPGPEPIRLSLDRALVRGVLVALAGGVVLALTGAFGMDDVPLGFRLTYWTLMMLIGGTWGHVCSRLIGRFLDFDRRPWLATGMLTVIISGPLSVMVWALTTRFFDDDRALQWERLPYFLGPVALVTGVLSALNVFLSRTPVQTHAAPAGAAPARFPARLPPKLRGATIRAVQSEDHYLRVHTDRGSDLILMRLTDALVELEGLEGAQTHRSWWVAREAVRDVRRRDGRATLILDRGLEAPVSRRYARALREAGWY